MQVDDYVQNDEAKQGSTRFCKSLPSSLRNSQEELHDKASGVVDCNQNNKVQKKTLTCIEALEMAIKMEVEKENIEHHENIPIVIPELKVSPVPSSESSQKQQVQHFGNQLTVPSKGPKASSNKKEAKNEESYGTTTLLVNPVNKKSASEVAKRSSIVKFTTCCPFVRLIKRPL